MVHQVLLLGAGFVTRPTAVELDKAGVKVTVGKQSLPVHHYHYNLTPHCQYKIHRLTPNSLPYP